MLYVRKLEFSQLKRKLTKDLLSPLRSTTGTVRTVYVCTDIKLVGPSLF